MARITNETENLLTYLRRELPTTWTLCSMLGGPPIHQFGGSPCAYIKCDLSDWIRWSLLVDIEQDVATDTTHYRFCVVDALIPPWEAGRNQLRWFPTPAAAIAHWELTHG